MNTLILKKPDGEIVRMTGDEATKKTKELPITGMVLECMYGGVPLVMPEGKYVIEQSEHKHLVESFIKSSY